MNDKSENTMPIINDVPEMSELIPGSKPKIKITKLKIVLTLLYIMVAISMIAIIVLSVISFQEEDEKKNEEIDPIPVEKKIFGKIFCKYLLKEKIYSNILYEGFIPPENFEVFVDGNKIEQYKNYKLNETGEYNITYQIKEKNFKMKEMFFEVNNLISVEMISTENCSLISMEQAFKKCKDLTEFSITGFFTKELESLNSLFSSTSLEKINLNNFDTSNVKDMSYMFSSTKMKKLDLNFFLTQNVENMEHMFAHSDS